MTTNLHDLIAASAKSNAATTAGSEMHRRLQCVSLAAPRDKDTDIVARIKSVPGLADFFGPDSRTELPVAGTLRGRFVSRRLDRVVISDATRTIRILDYKTDTDRTARRAKYIAQMKEYVALMRCIYPSYRIEAYILWLHDWTLERVSAQNA